MPLYDFQCNDCQKTCELLVRGANTPACPSCGSQRLEKLISLTAPQGKSAALVSSARAQASREGHFSHYKPSERPKST